jgi:Cupin domain
MRRVVTGNDEHGVSVFVSDEVVEPLTIALMPGASFLTAWGADAPVVLPTDGTPPPAVEYLPPAPGFRCYVITLPPAGMAPPADLDLAAAEAEMEEKLPGLAGHMDPARPGWHTTDTIDFNLILAGEVWLEADDGARVLLQTGDSVVVNGTGHAWVNESSAPCTMVTTSIGAGRGA